MRVQAFLSNPIENLQISVAGALRIGHGGDVFAEVIEARVHPLTIASASGNDGLIQRLAGNKAASHAARGWIGGNPVSKAVTHREFQQGRAKHEASLCLLKSKPTKTALLRCALPGIFRRPARPCTRNRLR